MSTWIEPRPDMPTPSLYAHYLVADRLVKILEEEAGEGPRGVVIEPHNGAIEYGDEYAHVSGAVRLRLRAYSLTPEEREEVVMRIVERTPGATILRREGDVHIYGHWTNGVSYSIFGGPAVCKRVQVGTRVVEKPDPDYEPEEVPTIQVEEPVYEYRCPDPIVAAGLI